MVGSASSWASKAFEASSLVVHLGNGAILFAVGEVEEDDVSGRCSGGCGCSAEV